MRRRRHPHSFINLVKLLGLTILTFFVYILLKIQGKLRM
jgi:hypothetical protein